MATLLGGSMHIKGQSVRGRHELKDGDVLEVSGLVLEFRLKQSTPPAVTIPPAAGGATADQDLANC